MSTNTVETKIVFSGDNTNLKKAIEEVTKQTTVMKKGFDLTQAADQAAQAIKQRQQVEQELIKRGIISDPALKQKEDEQKRIRQQSIADRELYYQTIRKLEDDEKRKRMQSIGGQADAFADSQNKKSALQQELISRGLIADPKIAEAEKKAKDLATMRASARQSLALAGLSSTGLGGVGSGIGSGQAIGSALEAYGLKGAAGIAGIAGGVLAAGGTALESTIAYRKATANEYMSQLGRDRQFALSIPGGRHLLEAVDVFTGTNYELGRQRSFDRASENAELFSINNNKYNAAAIKAFGYREQIQNAEYNLAAVRDNRLPGIQTFNRSTATGEREDREARIRLQGQTQLVMAERELAKASGEYTANRSKAAKLTEQEIAIRKDYTLHVKQSESGDDASRKESLLKVQALNNDLIKLNQVREQTDAEAIGIKMKIGEATKARSQALMAQRQNEIDILQQRESTASSTQTRLGSMGPGGRAVGLAALEALKQIGIENAPPELISQAASIAPLEIQKMAESAGGGQFGGFQDRLRQLAPEDARDIGNLGNIRGQLNQQRIDQQAAQQSADEAVASTAFEAKKALYDLLEFLKNDIPLAINDLAARVRLAANQP